MLLAVVGDGNKHGNGSRRVARREIERDGGVTQRQFLSVGDVHVARGSRGKVGFFGADRDHVPIRGGHQDVRMIHILQVLRAPEVIAVAVGQDDVFDLRWIEPRFFVTGKNNVLGVVVIVQGVDLDDPGAGHQGPRGDDVRSQIVELIKHFSGRSHERSAPRRGRFRGRLAVVEISSRQIWAASRFAASK